MTHRDAKERQDAIRDYKALGKTNREVAEYFGLSYQYVKILCKGIAPQKKKQFDIAKAIEDKIPNFEYVGGYTDSDGYINIRCKKCGTILHKSYVTARHQQTTCEYCKKIEAEGKRAKEKKEKEAAKESRRREREEREALKKERAVERIHPCPVCGRITDRRKYCSDKCATDMRERRKDAARRARIKEAIVDNDITLNEVFERDHGVCYLCEGLCDWNDFTRKGNVFIVGPFYPTIEHVKPLSKGGQHSWANVRLAHHRCNSLKGNSPLS